MSDLDTPKIRDLATEIAALSRGLRDVPMLVDRVGNLDKQAMGTTRLAQDISEMALAACEAELRSIKALSSLIYVMRNVLPISSGSNGPIQALEDAERELDAAQARINKAIDVVQARSAASEPPA